VGWKRFGWENPGDRRETGLLAKRRDGPARMGCKLGPTTRPATGGKNVEGEGGTRGQRGRKAIAQRRDMRMLSSGARHKPQKVLNLASMHFWRSLGVERKNSKSRGTCRAKRAPSHRKGALKKGNPGEPTKATTSKKTGEEPGDTQENRSCEMKEVVIPNSTHSGFRLLDQTILRTQARLCRMTKKHGKKSALASPKT